MNDSSDCLGARDLCTSNPDRFSFIALYFNYQLHKAGTRSNNNRKARTGNYLMQMISIKHRNLPPSHRVYCINHQLPDSCTAHTSNYGNRTQFLAAVVLMIQISSHFFPSFLSLFFHHHKGIHIYIPSV